MASSFTNPGLFSLPIDILWPAFMCKIVFTVWKIDFRFHTFYLTGRKSRSIALMALLTLFKKVFPVLLLFRLPHVDIWKGKIYKC